MDDKKLNSNYIYNSIYQLFTLLLPIVLTPFVTRTIGAGGIGQYSYTRSIVSYFVLFGTMGSSLYAQREIAYVQKDKQKRSTTFWELFLLRCILLSISFLVYLFVSFQMKHYVALMLVQALDILAAYMDITWYFQGVENFKRIITRNIIVKLLTVAAILLLVRSPEDLLLYVCIYSVGNFCGQVLLWKNIYAEVQRFSYKNIQIRQHLRGILQLSIPQISIQIYLVIDKTMIELLTGNSAETGYYELAQTIQRACVTAVTAYGTVAASRVTLLRSQGKHQEIRDLLTGSHELVCFLAFPITFGIASIAHNMIPWLMGNDYLRVVELLIILCPLVIIIGFSNISGMQYLVPMGLQNRMTICSVLGAIINIAVNTCAIPRYGAVGAAAASIIAELAVLISQGCFLHGIVRLRPFLLAFIKALVSSAIMFVTLKITEVYLLQSAKLLHTLILLVEGIIVYLTMQFLLGNRIMLNVREYLWRRNGKE